MAVTRVVLRIDQVVVDRLVLDSATAAGRSPARIAELLTQALRDRLADGGTAAFGTEPGRAAAGRLSVTADGAGLDGIARAAAAAVGRALSGDMGSGPAPHRASPSANGGGPR
ncbi:hypothetical protein [Streptomyces sp. NBC_00038]|uniref:hypothetical protein n=1 Tax=Streptomyces sp. NBC_00038 TaxID=2903615 RepID=UPI002256A6BC|nr:hypothetical protein [Streptomyces sp. NBC_00038]MCX5561527.1 hypothetical protein [Streptomyces sp. NBC_00038]